MVQLHFRTASKTAQSHVVEAQPVALRLRVKVIARIEG